MMSGGESCKTDLVDAISIVRSNYGPSMLTGGILIGADLRGADLSEAELIGAKYGIPS